MALGIGFFFVLAANRGWIGPDERIALGATASALVFGAGIVLHMRYGQFWTALAAVGAGIAGAYATLAAAAALYDLVPEALALPLAAAIAAIATVVAVLWRSQLIAALGLLGAALAPALQALDVELTWEAAAFAVVVLVAIAAVSVPREWRELLIAGSVLVGAQVEWLAAEPVDELDPGTVAVTAAFVAALLGIAVGRQLVAAGDEVDALALAYALASFGVALIFAIQVFDDETDRGIALLVAAGAWALVFGAVHWRRFPDLGLAVGASALGLAAVGTAHLLSDSALALAWAAEALVLATVARQLRDARLQAMGIAYAALATVSALVSEGNPQFLFERGVDHLDGALPLAAAAAGAIGAALLAPAEYRPRTEAGLLAVVGGVRRTLETYRAGIREALLFGGAALATLSVSFVLVLFSFEWGHVASSAVAAAVGGTILAVAGRLRSDPLVVAAFVWLGVVLVEAWGYDGDAFEGDEGSRGGWSIVAASAGILGGSYALRVLQRTRNVLDVVCGVAIGIAFVAAAGGVVWIDPDDVPIGIGWLCIAGVYAGLSAGVFGREGLRELATVLWSLAVVALVGAEVVLIDEEVARAVAVAGTALGVGALGPLLRELRLWLAGAALAVGWSAYVLLVEVQPWLEEEGLELTLAIGSGACMVAAFGLAVLTWTDRRWRDLTTVVWVDGLVALLATERILVGDWRATVFFFALTGAAIALLAGPLREPRLWFAAAVLSGVTTIVTLAALTPPSHFFTSSESPAESLWVLLACILALGVLAATALDRQTLVGLGAVTGVLALYAVSLGILELAERVSGASVETDFERGHTAVSGLWALLGLGLLIAGLLRGSSALRYGGLALFGLSLVKIFVYDLAELSSVARAFSFIFVGGLLLAGGFFLQRLSHRLGPRVEPGP
jgi:uncharacterized membrane protein